MKECILITSAKTRHIQYSTLWHDAQSYKNKQNLSCFKKQSTEFSQSIKISLIKMSQILTPKNSVKS